MTSLIQSDSRHIWHPFTQAKTAPPPIVIRAAKGAVLYAEDGKEYLDLISSWWVNPYGHAHPRIAKAIADQAHTLEQVIFADFTHAPAVKLAERLTALLPDDLNRVFFSDNGSTAVEVALKISCQYWHNRGEKRSRFLSFDGGYHGDTFGAMSLGASFGFFEPFRDLMFQVDALPFPSTWMGDAEVEKKEQQALQKLEDYLDRYGKETAALIIEPLVQGAAGMRMCRPEFLRKLAEKVKAANVLLIFDEVMTGFGRTGASFSCVKAGVTPDLICLSKGLSGGFLPLSVTVCRDDIYQAFQHESFDKAFAHGHSFTANPLGCAAALVGLELLEETQERRQDIEALHRRFLEKLSGNKKIEHCRYTGTIMAFNIKTEEVGYTATVAQTLKRFFLEKGFLIRPLGNIVYLLPPYCMTDEQLYQSYDILEEALTII